MHVEHLEDARAAEVFDAVVPLTALLPADSPRLGGSDETHSALLAEADAELPPILVHRKTMRVVDGMHRLRAAELRGASDIRVRFFDGDEHEAFVLAVKANTTHGLPLSLADRKTAAVRIMTSHPQWSDRAVAVAVGLARRTIARIRSRSTGGVSQLNSRVGLDGRARPLSSANGRRQAGELFEQRPGATLREVASASGISLATARDVRERIRHGEDPVPPGVRRAGGVARAADGRRGPKQVDGVAEPIDLASAFHRLASDPSLRLSDAGRRLLRWLNASANAVGREERGDLLDAVPSYCVPVVAGLAREYARMWHEVADELDHRGRSAS
ncbi:ParB/RepB/Spo0J family partition protein [Saccharothrix luteola]|uniref:ParB/RepB/Spo0J family partition protein n=1 Tax=Saccharothrix luteola TaxID=2893018 RepID=UPI001E618A23|nr:ParB N-terminal domain-containing protein [Saccharothrix luteola]MCC8251529.1 ParB N-terminal domain-containing protein [Saccharothrix luteola]